MAPGRPPERPRARVGRAEVEAAAPVRVGFAVHSMTLAGAESVIAATVDGLAGKIEPTILCLDEVGELGERYRRQGVPVICLERRDGLDARVAWRIGREVRRRRLEVLHAHQYGPFFYAALGRLVGGGRARLILTEHGRHFPDVVSARRRWANRLLLGRLAHAVNACSEFSARALVEREGLGADRVEVIPNGVDLERCHPADDVDAARRALGLDPGARLLVCVARFHPVKDHETLVRAFARVAAARPGTELLLVGDGPERARIEALAAELAVGSHVRFLGLRDDVPAILRAADLFVLTSASEAAPLTLLEAMATGLPAVATAVGGVPEILHDGVEGLLVPRADPEAAAAAIEALLGDRARAAAMGRAGRSRVEESYRLENTVAAYGALYERLAAGRRDAAGPAAGR